MSLSRTYLKAHCPHCKTLLVWGTNCCEGWGPVLDVLATETRYVVVEADTPFSLLEERQESCCMDFESTGDYDCSDDGVEIFETRCPNRDCHGPTEGTSLEYYLWNPWTDNWVQVSFGAAQEALERHSGEIEGQAWKDVQIGFDIERSDLQNLLGHEPDEEDADYGEEPLIVATPASAELSSTLARMDLSAP